ncbi:MAG: Ca-activated chloride channel family protein [Gammaproteobacteria bacterium]|jgi:Ca-activated chloride channel family protein
MMSEFHFIRPYWFIALIPLIILVWMLAKRHLVNKHWESVCDPALLPYILVGRTGVKKYTNISLFGFVSLLMVFALAGPSWERLPEPVFEKESALVIAMDLSYSMYADDIKPSRLERARFKISDLLDLRQEGQTALIVYAGDAFTVTPLTDDIKTIKSQLNALTPQIMPSPGSSADIALEKAAELLKQAGNSEGHILLVTDEVDSQLDKAFSKTKRRGYKVSLLGIGTEEGAPVKLGDSGFLKDKAGTIVIPKLNQGVLRLLASSGGGYYETSQLGDGDIERLNRLFNSGLEKTNETASQFETDRWREFGPWLILLILPIVAFGFRRGYLALFVCVLIQTPDDVMAFEWDDLWLNKNQQAMRALNSEQAELASELFNNKEWKAAANYRKGDFATVEELLNEHEDTRSIYNRANAMAKQGRYEDAIAAYDEVLESKPEHADAIFNRDLIKKELEKQQQQQSDSDQKSDEESDQQEQEDSESKEQQSESEQKESDQQENSEEQQSSQQQQEEQDNSEQQQDGKKQESEEQQKSEQEKEEQQAKESGDKEEEEQQQAQASTQEEKELDEQQQATEQWLRRIPDDPSGLLRRKFKYQYQQQKRRPSNNEKYW